MEKSLSSAGLTYFGLKEIVMHKISSMILEIVVARAAPLASILGAPNKPKIKTAFSPMFIRTALVFRVEFYSGFGYERRAEYFKDELAALIAWSYKDGVPTSSIVGSYAGAVGYPQFMPSNIPKFGVDYDGNGHIDLRNSAVDAIGSIANYLAQHGWQRNQPIAFAARYIGNNPDSVIAKDLTLPTPYGVLKSQGVMPMNPIVQIDDLDLVNVIQLQENYGHIYYITYPNFQVITT